MWVLPRQILVSSETPNASTLRSKLLWRSKVSKERTWELRLKKGTHRFITKNVSKTLCSDAIANSKTLRVREVGVVERFCVLPVDKYSIWLKAIREDYNKVRSQKEPANWATPRASKTGTEDLNTWLVRRQKWREKNQGFGMPLSVQTSIDVGKTSLEDRKLNARWVETLMGLPVGWVTANTKFVESFYSKKPQSPANKNTTWATPAAEQRGDSLAVWLRRSLKRVKNGDAPFMMPLQVEVEASRRKLDLSASALASDLDLSQDTEVLIQQLMTDDV